MSTLVLIPLLLPIFKMHVMCSHPFHYECHDAAHDLLVFLQDLLYTHAWLCPPRSLRFPCCLLPRFVFFKEFVKANRICFRPLDHRGPCAFVVGGRYIPQPRMHYACPLFHICVFIAHFSGPSHEVCRRCFFNVAMSLIRHVYYTFPPLPVWFLYY